VGGVIHSRLSHNSKQYLAMKRQEAEWEKEYPSEYPRRKSKRFDNENFNLDSI
jgi:hypothetical protein